MNAPVDRWEPYRVVTDYEALQDGVLDRIDDLETTFEQIEMAGEMARGQLQKCLTRNPGKPITRKRDCRHASNRRMFGWESLAKTLKGTGLALVLVLDDERFADTKAQLMKRKRQRQPAYAGLKRPTWLFTKKNAAAMGRKGFSEKNKRRLVYHASMQPIYAHFPRINEPITAIVRHQRKAAKARWRKMKRQGFRQND